MPKHAKPEWVKYWELGQPICCHTCHHYSEDGKCQKHQQEPPEEFAARHLACPDWMDGWPPF